MHANIRFCMQIYVYLEQIYIFACKYTYIKNKYTHLHAKYMYIWNKLGTKTTFQIIFVLVFETNFWAVRKVSFYSPKLLEWLSEKKFFKNFFGLVPALHWGSESTYLSKVWKIPQSLNLNIIFWNFPDMVVYTSAIVKKI